MRGMKFSHEELRNSIDMMIKIIEEIQKNPNKTNEK